MKKILLLSLLACFILSCQKTSTPVSPYFIKALVDSLPYSSSTCTSDFDSASRFINIAASFAREPAYPLISLSITNWTGSTGTFAIDSVYVYGYYVTSPNTIIQSKSGSITITSITATAFSGTFSFTCTDGTVVSNGTFTAEKD